MAAAIRIYLMLLFIGYCMTDDRSYRCNFENGFCRFLMNDKYNMVNWIKANSLSKIGRSGPRIDHTLGNEYGTYIFVDVNLLGGKQVKLQTKALNGDYCVSFSYHMIGKDIGDLEVYRQNVDNEENIIRYFYQEGSQGFRWKEATFEVQEKCKTTQKDYRIIFSINHSSPKKSTGHIALDDIELTPGKCPENNDTSIKLCSFDYYDCGYYNLGKTAWKWQAEGHPTSKSIGIPFVDHTLGTRKGGYWFIEASNTTLEDYKYGFLRSPNFRSVDNSTGCLQFYYYMGSNNKATQFGPEGIVSEVMLNADIKDSNGKSVNLVRKYIGHTNENRWIFVENEGEFPPEFQISFYAKLETEIPVIIAVDDIQLLPGLCPKEDPCSPNPCLNNGKCEVSPGNSFVICNCVQGYKGEFCETASDCPHN